MENKAYIVVNEEQEREVLEKLEREGLVWIMGGEKPTEWVPSRDAPAFKEFPIVLTDEGEVSWWFTIALEDEEIVFDGRKEEHMSEKYVVSQEFMNELKEWRDNNNLINNFIGYVDLELVPVVVTEWWKADMANTPQTNNRLIAMIRWLNGEEVFEVEKPKQWVVRSKEHDEEGYYLYVNLSKDPDILHLTTFYGLDRATRFDTKEEAESWANSHQEVVEVEG